MGLFALIWLGQYLNENYMAKLIKVFQCNLYRDTREIWWQRWWTVMKDWTPDLIKEEIGLLSDSAQ